MNRPIVRLYGLIVVLFVVLVAFTSRWTIFEASSLRNNANNVRQLLAQQRVARGEILAADGRVLAKSVGAGEGTYERRYPTGSLFGNVVGYSYLTPGRSGIEEYRNEALTGEASNGLQGLLDQVQGRRPGGDTVKTTLVPRAQRAGAEALSGYEGAVVALDPRTGAVEAMVSSPSYDPNGMRTKAGQERIEGSARSPLFDRATEGGYAPGSTFKVITATAALDTGAFTPESRLSGRNGIVISGTPLHNDANESFGEISLTTALALSVNTVYAQVAEKVGRETLQRYMERFGFDVKPKLDFPSEEMSASGEYFEEVLTPPGSDLVDVGRLGIGQDHLRVTPMQMAEVAAAVANHGKLMVPHLTAKIVDPEGSTVETVSPKIQSVVMKRSTADEVTKMMEAVVNEGTGTGAQITGIQVAGKTGTAETALGQTNDAWFIAFAPASKPTVAVAATVAKVPGYGATYALPVAKAVMEALLR